MLSERAGHNRAEAFAPKNETAESVMRYNVSGETLAPGTRGNRAAPSGGAAKKNAGLPGRRVLLRRGPA